MNFSELSIVKDSDLTRPEDGCIVIPVSAALYLGSTCAVKVKVPFAMAKVKDLSWETGRDLRSANWTTRRDLRNGGATRWMKG